MEVLKEALVRDKAIYNAIAHYESMPGKMFEKLDELD